MCYIDGYNFVSTYGSVLFKFVSLRGWIVVVFVPNYNVECLVSVHQQLVLNMSPFFCTHRTSLVPIPMLGIILVNNSNDVYDFIGNILKLSVFLRGGLYVNNHVQ